jgi:hypothetical protein
MSRQLTVVAIALLLCAPALLRAQDDEVPLGDVARAARKSKLPEPPQAQGEDQKVIDNDNFSAMMSKAEAERLNGKPIFSIDPSGKTFSMTSPDGTCSLSFDAKATALISTPYIASELPQDELLKLEGPASIHEDVLEVSLHNGSGWELKEIVVGITELRTQPGAELLPASLITATDQTPERLPDSTVLYHLKATAGHGSITVFRANLLGDFSDVKDWHWSLVSARGIPPASMNATTSQQAANAAPPQAAAQDAPPPPTVTELPSEPTPAEKH